MKNLKRITGIAAISEALIYISAFIFFGALWSYPSAGSPSEKMVYLAENYLGFSIVYFFMYIVFGVLLAVLVVGLHEKLRRAKNPALAIGSLFGAIWVGLVIASGMIANIGLAYAIDLMDDGHDKAFAVWEIVSVMTESLGGGNELVGGLWVLLISVIALQAGELPRALNFIGLLVGVAGIATVYPLDLFTEIFGVTQIVWFIWLGIHLLLREDAQRSTLPAANG